MGREEQGIYTDLEQIKTVVLNAFQLVSETEKVEIIVAWG